MRHALLALLLLLSAPLFAGPWGLELGGGEYQNLLGPSNLSTTAVPFSDYILSHQKTGGPSWSLEYWDLDNFSGGASYFFRLERRSWFRDLPSPGQKLRWNAGFSLGWQWTTDFGAWESSPELGLMAELRIYRGLYLQCEGQQWLGSGYLKSDLLAGLSLRGFGSEGMEIRAGVPAELSGSYPHFDNGSTELGLFRVSLRYRFAGPIQY